MYVCIYVCDVYCNIIITKTYKFLYFKSDEIFSEGNIKLIVLSRSKNHFQPNYRTHVFEKIRHGKQRMYVDTRQFCMFKGSVVMILTHPPYV